MKGNTNLQEKARVKVPGDEVKLKFGQKITQASGREQGEEQYM